MSKVLHVAPSMGKSKGGAPRSVGQLCDQLVRQVEFKRVEALEKSVSGKTPMIISR